MASPPSCEDIKQITSQVFASSVSEISSKHQITPTPNMVEMKGDEKLETTSPKSPAPSCVSNQTQLKTIPQPKDNENGEVENTESPTESLEIVNQKSHKAQVEDKGPGLSIEQRLKRVKRKLFEDDDQNEVTTNFENSFKKICNEDMKTKSKKWNFDFELGVPSANGDWEWEEECTAPNFYRCQVKDKFVNCVRKESSNDVSVIDDYPQSSSTPTRESESRHETLCITPLVFYGSKCDRKSATVEITSVPCGANVFLHSSQKPLSQSSTATPNLSLTSSSSSLSTTLNSSSASSLSTSSLLSSPSRKSFSPSSVTSSRSSLSPGGSTTSSPSSGDHGQSTDDSSPSLTKVKKEKKFKLPRDVSFSSRKTNLRFLR